MNPIRVIALSSALLLIGTATSQMSARTAAGPPPPVTGNVEHGRYLAEHVAMCVECHSGRDGQGNIVASERYMGGTIPPGPQWSSNWAMRAPRNSGLPGYTEDQAIRLLTEGAINREGFQLRLPMPRFRMTTQDAADIVAFLKSLQ
jgi:mono/diheme cytochrome c family protein